MPSADATERRLERPDPPEDVPPEERKNRRPAGATAEEALNSPTMGLYVADRLNRVDQIVTLRVHAQPGKYFNCYYKGRKRSYHHVRLRGDGSPYLDGYLPRDPAGEKLWLKLKKKKQLKLTVKIVTRPDTISGNCIGQVEIIDHTVGWDYSKGGIGKPGTLQRRLANAKDKTAARNRPPISTVLESPKRFVGRKVSLRVRGRIGRYYECRYRDAERTHYALELQGDAFKALRAYVPRNEEGRRLTQALSADEGMQLTVDVTIPEARYDSLCGDQVEVLRWSRGWKAAPGVK